MVGERMVRCWWWKRNGKAGHGQPCNPAANTLINFVEPLVMMARGISEEYGETVLGGVYWTPRRVLPPSLGQVGLVLSTWSANPTLCSFAPDHDTFIAFVGRELAHLTDLVLSITLGNGRLLILILELTEFHL